MTVLDQFLRSRRQGSSSLLKCVVAATFFLSGMIDAATVNAGIVVRQYSSPVTNGNVVPVTKPILSGLTPSLPKPSVSSPSLPKPAPTGASPSLPKPEPTGASPSLPKPAPTGASPSLPKPEPTGASPSLPKPAPTGASPSLPYIEPGAPEAALPQPEPIENLPVDQGSDSGTMKPPVVDAGQEIIPVHDAPLVVSDVVDSAGNSGKNDESPVYGDNGSGTSGNMDDAEAPVDNADSGSSNDEPESGESGNSGKNDESPVYGDDGSGTSGNMDDVEEPAYSGNSQGSSGNYYGEDYEEAGSGSGKSEYGSDLFSDYNGNYNVIYSPGTECNNYPRYDDASDDGDSYSESYPSEMTYYGGQPGGGLNLYSELEDLKSYGANSGYYSYGYPIYLTPVPEPSLDVVAVIGILGWGIQRIRRRLRKPLVHEHRAA